MSYPRLHYLGYKYIPKKVSNAQCTGLAGRLELVFDLLVGDLHKSQLRNALDPSVETHNGLSGIGTVDECVTVVSKQLLVGENGWLVQAVELRHNQLVDLLVELVSGQALAGVGTVEEAQTVELGTWYRLGKQQGLGSLGPAQSQEQGGRGGTLGDKTQVGERRQHVGVVLVVHVDQVTQGDNGSRKTNDRTVEGTDQDLGVVVQQVSQVNVSTDKVLSQNS